MAEVVVVLEGLLLLDVIHHVGEVALDDDPVPLDGGHVAVVGDAEDEPAEELAEARVGEAALRAEVGQQAYLADPKVEKLALRLAEEAARLDLIGPTCRVTEPRLDAHRRVPVGRPA